MTRRRTGASSRDAPYPARSPTPYWGEFARRALSGEKFEMKRMR